MAGLADLFEPEELVGSLWHRLIGDAGNAPHFESEAAYLDDWRRRLQVFFHGLGGDGGVEIKATGQRQAGHRRSFLGRIGHASTAVPQARFDGDSLYLPDVLDVLPDRRLNGRLYQWLAAYVAVAGDRTPPVACDPLRSDLEFVRFAIRLSEQVRARYPGLDVLYEDLKPALLAVRPVRRLPEKEAAVEAVVRALLGEAVPDDGLARAMLAAVHDRHASLEEFTADAGYKPFLPLILWGEIVPRTVSGKVQRDTVDMGGDHTGKDEEDNRVRRARRKKSDQIERDDPMVLARFEAVLSWAEMMNINRAVDDEDEENAKRAADDSDEIGLANISKKAATRLKFDLDLSPEDAEHERLAAKYTYQEWDYRRAVYHRDHCRVLAGRAPLPDSGTPWQPGRQGRRRIRAVRRQFEALRPKREILRRQVDGPDIDVDALIRAACDLAATGEGSNRIYTCSRAQARDLAVAVLIDTSRSSQSWVEGYQVLDISKEALAALAAGLSSAGDDNAIYSFSSLRRERVNVLTVKGFDEPLSTAVLARISALKPGFYTRLGAAIRHVAARLCERGNEKRLLLVISDGKPNDLDHYEGRYGVEDTAMAVREARRAGLAVYGITIDKKAQAYFPHVFGRNAYSIVRHPGHLTRALPQIYRHLVT